MTLPAYLYRDPERVYLEQEARTCKGCIHVARITVAGETRTMCERGKRYGARCKCYDDGSDR